MKKKYFPKFNSSGFTLLELIVVFSVIAILSTIGIVSFVSYSQTQTVEEGSQDIVAAINLARSRSLSQYKPSECVSLTLEGNRVVIVPESRIYRTEVVCSGTAFVTSSHTLPRGVDFNESETTTNSIFFPILTFGTRGAGDISVTGFGIIKTITVDAQGGVR